MGKDEIYIGDLVSIKKKLQILIALPDWGIVIEETNIISNYTDVDGVLEPIDSFVVFFPATDETLTIPKNCLIKINIVEE
jgi:hypothetical protein